MSGIQLIIPERVAKIGSFMVGRLLPFRQKRMVGPFIYTDQMGPLSLNDNSGLMVLPHPHIGLSTLTYLLEGTIVHRDNLGNVIEISPGAVNWMTAGRGVVHSERSPESLHHTAARLHGLQIWVALPRAFEETEPGFVQIPADEIPSWTSNGVHFKLIAGEFAGWKSPVPVYSPMYLLEIQCNERSQLELGGHLYGESGIYILEGEVKVGDHSYGEKQLLIPGGNSPGSFEAAAGTRLFVLGGEAFPEERFIDWNFVSSDKNRIHQAVNDWKEGRFTLPPGETACIPYPG